MGGLGDKGGKILVVRVCVLLRPWIRPDWVWNFVGNWIRIVLCTYLIKLRVE